MHLGLSRVKYVLAETNILKLTIMLHRNSSFHVKKVFPVVVKHESKKYLHSIPRLQSLLQLQEKVQMDGMTDCEKDVSVLEENFYEKGKIIAFSNDNHMTIVNIENFIKAPVYCWERFPVMEDNVFLQSIYGHDTNLINSQSTEHLFLPFSHKVTNVCRITHVHDFLSSNRFGEYSFVMSSNKNKADSFSARTKNVKPTEEQLISVKNYLYNAIIYFFQKAPEFNIYHKNILFQNNIRGVTTRGLYSYINQVYLLRLCGPLRYSNIQAEVLKITYHTDDGTVRARWRMKGLSRHKILRLLGRLRKFSWQKIVEEESEWLDGFSIFSVDQDGLVFKHVCDKMIPDDDQVGFKPVSFRTRILTLLKLSRRPSPSGIQAMLTYPTSQNNHIYKLSGKKEKT